MHISKVELENIKSHVHSTYHFQLGTTAITGENGAGKTTILEAIAWTLFDLLDYKKEEFLRRGSGKGIVKVTIKSGLDERDYVIYRDTATGYFVNDPALKIRVANKKEEVTRFLWQHLGLEPGTDLRSLFKEAVGVPQGTLTAIFLAAPAERKTTFDRLLKVEEYRQAAEKLLATTRFIDGSIFAVREKIARAEGELARADVTENELAQVSEQAANLTIEADAVSAGIAAKQVIVNALNEAEKRIETLNSSFEKLKTEKSKAEFVLQQRETELRQACTAVETIERVKNDADRHVEILGRLNEIERERAERDRLREQQAKVESAIIKITADQKRINDLLENALKAHHEVETLKPKLNEQEALEKDVESFRTKFAQAKAVENQIKSLDERLERLRKSYKENLEQLAQLESKTATANELPTLEKRISDLISEIAALRTNLERDQLFQTEIKNGLCPILSQKCLNLKNGETLESFVTSQFTDIKTLIGVLEKEKEHATAGLRAARESEKAAISIDALRKCLQDFIDEGMQLKMEKESLQKMLEGVDEIESQLAAAEKKLAALDNPKAKIKFYKAEAARDAELRRDATKIDQNLERLESERRLLVEQLELYKDLNQILEQLIAERDATVNAHRTFIANEAVAGLFVARQNALHDSQQELAGLAVNFAKVEKEIYAESKEYDHNLHLSEKASLLEAEKRLAEAMAKLDAAKKREEQLKNEMSRFTELRESLQAEFIEKERLEKVAETTAFIRDTLKEAAPRVARNYVHHVSIEANQMFREISGKAEQTLEWCEDYGILLEEDGHRRPFATLSGGEQMAAALSVRLAILKQLSDIRIAFFDEPTTNMDAARRENLAMQISQIKNFDQLFVISHDDSFEGYADHVLSLDKVEFT